MIAGRKSHAARLGSATRFRGGAVCRLRRSDVGPDVVACTSREVEGALTDCHRHPRRGVQLALIGLDRRRASKICAGAALSDANRRICVGSRSRSAEAPSLQQRWTLWLGYGCWRQSVSVSSVGVVSTASHPAEPHAGSVSAKLNWLRAGVLGANDGIVSTAGIVVGVAAATVARGPILTAGIAGLAAGAVSMALGEYVSVSTQRDTERALLSKERGELREDPAAELDELAALYEAKGLSTATARTVAEELTDHDAFAAHAEVELGIDPERSDQPLAGRPIICTVVHCRRTAATDRNPVAAHHSPNPGDRRGSARSPRGHRSGIGKSGRGAQATRNHTQHHRR